MYIYHIYVCVYVCECVCANYACVQFERIPSLDLELIQLQRLRKYSKKKEIKIHLDRIATLE